MGRAERIRKAGDEAAVSSYNATDSDLPEIMQPETPKAAPQSVAGIATQEESPNHRPEIVRVESERKNIQIDSKIIETFLRSGDLRELTSEQRVSYYNAFCGSVGLNPITRPLEFIVLNGKVVLYARRDCTDQLRKIHGVSITGIETRKEDGLYVSVAHAKDKSGKVDVATGAVSVEGLKGESLANAIMKSETKAKRRVTLSICGLGLLDESEIDLGSTTETLTSAPARDTAAPVTVAVEPEQKKESPKETPKEPPSSPKAPEAASPQPQPSPATGNGKAPSASPDAYQPLPEAASGRDKITAMEKFCFGASPCDNRAIRYLPMAVGVPSLLAGPFDIEQNGKWNPKKWNTVMSALADRKERFAFIEQQLALLGRESFVKWALAMVASARGRGVFGK